MSSFEFSSSTRQGLGELCGLLRTHHLREYWTNVLEWEVAGIVDGCEAVVASHAEALFGCNLLVDAPAGMAEFITLTTTKSCLSFTQKVSEELSQALVIRQKMVPARFSPFDAEMRALAYAVESGLPRQIKIYASKVSLRKVVLEAYRKILGLLCFAEAEMPAAFMRPQISAEQNARELEHLKSSLSGRSPLLNPVSGDFLPLLTNESLWQLMSNTSWSMLYSKVAVLVTFLLKSAMEMELVHLRNEFFERNTKLRERLPADLSHRIFCLELLNPMSPLLSRVMPRSVVLPPEAELNAVIAQMGRKAYSSIDNSN